MNTQDAQAGVRTLLELIEYGRNYPDGAIGIGQHYYDISEILGAIKDIRMRALVGGETQADSLLLAILSGLIVPM